MDKERNLQSCMVRHDNHSGKIGHTSLKKSFIIGISLNIGYAIIELISGLYFGSMSMVSDAGHNFVDVLSLSLAFSSLLIAGIKPNSKFTFGYKKSTILAAVFNSVLLIISVFMIIKESIERISEPVEINGYSMIFVAAIGIIINGFTGWLFHKDQNKDINVKAAFVHLMADALISLGVVVSGLIIIFTGWNLIDPVFSIFIAIIILIMTVKILRKSIYMAVDGVPEGIDIDEIERALTKINGIEDIHHTHIWAISTSESAITAHIVVESSISINDLEVLKNEIRKTLMTFRIVHSTLEFEIPGENCINHC